MGFPANDPAPPQLRRPGRAFSEVFKQIVRKGTYNPTFNPYLDAVVSYGQALNLSYQAGRAFRRHWRRINDLDKDVQKDLFPIPVPGSGATLNWDPTKWNHSVSDWTGSTFTGRSDPTRWILWNGNLGIQTPGLDQDFPPDGWYAQASSQPGFVQGWIDGFGLPDMPASTQFHTYIRYDRVDDQAYSPSRTRVIDQEAFWPKPGAAPVTPEIVPGTATETKWVEVPQILPAVDPPPARTNDPQENPETERGPRPRPTFIEVPAVTPRPRPGTVSQPVPPAVVLVPGRGPAVSPGPITNPTAVPAPRPARDGTGVTDRKARVRYGTVVQYIRRVVGGVTEFLDALDAFYYALPKSARPGWYLIHGRGGQLVWVKRWNASVAQRIQAVRQHYPEVDLTTLFQNILRMEVTDRLAGSASNRLNRSQRSNRYAPDRAPGYEFGPWDTIDLAGNLGA